MPSVIAEGDDVIAAHKKAVQEGLELFHLHAANAERLRTRVEEQQAEIAALRQENEFISTSLTQASQERDHYMRAFTEALTQLTAIQALINDALNKTKVSPYAPRARIKQVEERRAVDQRVLAGLESDLKELNGKEATG